MWLFGKKSARRQEIRRSKSERQLAWYQRLRGPLGVSTTTIVLGSAIGVAIILNAGGDALNIQVGQSVPRAITARVEFHIEDLQQTNLMRIQARDGAPNYYKLNTSLLKDIRGRLMSALPLVQTRADDPSKLFQEAAQNKVYLDPGGLNELSRLAEQSDGGAEFQRAVEQAVEILSKQPLVETDEKAGQRRAALEAALLDPDSKSLREWHVPVTSLLFNSRDAAHKATEAAMAAFPELLQSSMQASIFAMLVDDAAGTVKPIYRYDSARSIQAAQEAGERVPVQYLTYAKQAILTDPGEISPQEMDLLKAEHQAYQRALLNQPDSAARWLAILGRSLLAFLVAFGLAVHITPRRPEEDTNALKKAFTVLALLLVLGVARTVFVNVSDVPAHFAVGAQAFAAALLAIIYSWGSVLGVCGVLAALLTVATQQGVGFFIILLAVSGTMVFGLREVRNRGKIVLVGALGGLVALAATVAASLVEQQPLSFALWRGAWAAGATLAAAFLIEGILPGLERLFGFSTGMTLLEWCDANKPLLRLMAAEAPGTYNHSLLVGALAESAAKAIDANGLLARAGAYYHDIGKINKPEYFIENQSPRSSRHERLSPAMSLLIIIGHVKDGIEMAKEYGLPASLHPFIAEHHGTTLVEYFYHAANKARKPDDPEVSETEFRYPGPKPQSRETAIVMLCDGVESAVRALAEPTPGRIESVVGEIVQKRLLDGQFDECDLTFHELAAIQKSLVKSLCGIYHARIVYPSSDEPKLTVRRESVGT